MRSQGKAIVEWSDGVFMVMTPDGQISTARTVLSVGTIVRRWATKDVEAQQDAAFVKVEWRGEASRRFEASKRGRR